MLNCLRVASSIAVCSSSSKGKTYWGARRSPTTLRFKRCEVGDAPRCEDLLAEEQDPLLLVNGFECLREGPFGLATH